MNVMILVPTYNERGNIGTLIPNIFAALPNTRVMVIDDHSPDGTAEEIRALQTRYSSLILYQRTAKEGLGRAYTDAFCNVFSKYPDTDVICTMDADGSHNPAHLPGFLAALENADLVVGSRYVPGGSIIGWERWRKFLSLWGNRYCRAITRLPAKDCTSGFMCIQASSLRGIDFSYCNPSGYAFTIYLKYWLWQNQARIKEMPICFRNRTSGESKLSLRIFQEELLFPWKLRLKMKRKK